MYGVHRRRGSALRRDEGYTLTEMLIVIGVIGLIAAVLTPTLFGQLGRARQKAAGLQLETVSSQIELFMADTGRYPTSQEGLGALITEPAEASGWTGPYVRDQKALTDPWGRPLRYVIDAENNYSVATLGADGKAGGTGANRDLTVPIR